MQIRGYLYDGAFQRLVEQSNRSIAKDNGGPYLCLDSSSDTLYRANKGKTYFFRGFSLLHERVVKPGDHVSLDRSLNDNIPPGIYRLEGDDITTAHFRANRLHVAGKDLLACERLFDLVAGGRHIPGNQIDISWDNPKDCYRISRQQPVAEPE